jgi:hypothetical protein
MKREKLEHGDPKKILKKYNPKDMEPIDEE